MISWSSFVVISFFPFFVYLSVINEPNRNSNKKIQNITDKIDKLALKIQNYSSLDERNALLSNIEKQLQNAAQELGSKGKAHVELIMEGIRLKTFNKSKDLYKALRVENERITAFNENNKFENEDDINDLATKINLLIKYELERQKSAYDKHNFLENIKKRILKTVMEKQEDIIENAKYLPFSDTRRIKNYDERNDRADFNNNSNIIMDEILNNIKSDIEIDNNNIENEISKSIKSIKALPICEDVYDRICLGIKNMNSLKCLYDDNVVPLDKLCNDKIDCPDRSDEKYCGSQAMERMQYSNWVMTNIESYFGKDCFKLDNRGLISSKNNQIVKDVLQMQADFKEKYKNYSFLFQSTNLINKEDVNYESNVKVKANEIALIVSSLALTLDAALCSHRSDEFLTRRKAIFDTEDETVIKPSWPPINCNCERGLCTNCTNDCKRVCWDQNSLSLWNCESIDGTDVVSINSLCDGKLDCLDESDEKGCVKGNGYEKFEAQEKYGKLLKMLDLKIAKERSSTQKMLLNLRNLILQVQQLTMKTVTNPFAIRRLRNKCYSLLGSIYSDIISQSSTAQESEEAYIFLLSINESLGAALKSSHTGNSRIIADGCLCRNGSCVKTFCSKVCNKACSVEIKLMRYQCNRGSNTTVSVDEICNGKEDCPNGSDEVNCKKEDICRRHHLILLRNNLQDVGSNFKGTALGELLLSWKTKIISTVKFAEKNGRPKPKVIKKIVKDIIRDLLVTYGSVEDYRRSNTDYALPKFLTIAQMIMETLKTCGK